MVDVVSQEKRSRIMGSIRGRNTKPEIALRSGLHRLGLRFSLRSKLPGRPDITLPRHRTVVFFHGCFWHGHEGCALFRLPKTRPEFWRDKIEANRERDARVLNELAALRWRIAVVRECSIRGSLRRELSDICLELADWIRGGDDAFMEISGWVGAEPVGDVTP
ncbi:very short patch repair endonuclease [Haliea sp.]|jgi:DNA mismatch endonuclease (patch repair protein)|uniref:very short patch repair endonuclease n=1 Tax=Haliea sp. TaxID=1932666 RepID=UPI000C3CD5C8|nr:very short patch repair endonuclease [Haliea sp.]MAD65019.1 very short patch repair endonuclease [Haliea sp.]MAY94529.1 very short patch repair endonuclease [Haliea sp.]MBP71534.1 very short patch repair endonuclease [Haliea sp.]HBX72717.1 very short patch repair endonuclease [Halieaceae bacterium]|tara:strand:+ start:1454 stop:1942 length:489 start_codon:yes stop_codon:yes gene_type:complete